VYTAEEVEDIVRELLKEEWTRRKERVVKTRKMELEDVLVFSVLQLGREVRSLAEKVATKEDLKNIATKEDLKALWDGIHGLRAEVGGLRSEVNKLKVKVDEMRGGVAGLKARVDKVEARISRLEVEVSGIKSEQISIRSELRAVKWVLGFLSAVATSTLVLVASVLLKLLAS